MKTFAKKLYFLLFILLLTACPDALEEVQTELVLEPFVTGLTSPVGMTYAMDDSNRLFIVQQTGQVLIYQNDALEEQAFLDISSLVKCCGERGLLGFTFHPSYSDNGLFYVNYINKENNTVIAEFKVSSDANVADIDSERQLLTIVQPKDNHNGGHLAFGPDGYLYIATGDGGGAGDPHGEVGNSQDPSNLLGKILRIDVDGDPYTIPADNPFVDDPEFEDEIWSYGLRNPWRFSFDRETGDMFIGDVGQDELEEIDFQAAASTGGENYGWRLMEGSQCFNPSSDCNPGDLSLPILEYAHEAGRCSVTGGYSYRGSIAQLQGSYIYGDFCSGDIWQASEDAGSWEASELLTTPYKIASFAEDADGELYVIDLSGGIYKFVTK